MMIHMELLQQRSWLPALAVLALIVAMAPQLGAQQTSETDVYWLATFNNNGNSFNYSQPIYVVNPGGPDGDGRCANIYVFDNEGQMLECCSCPVGNNGLLTLSVKGLTANPLTAVIPKSGAIKIVSSRPAQNLCSAMLHDLEPVPTLRVWMTHIQIATTSTNVLARGTQTPTLNVLPFDQSRLGPEELSYLYRACEFTHYLGSGKGFCACPQTSATE